MADKLQKFLAKLNSKDFLLAQALITQVLARDFDNLDVKPLKGHKDFYRVRNGRLRLIFHMKSNKVTIYQLSNRDEQTYKDF